MSKHISQALQGVNVGAAALPQEEDLGTVKGLFMLFHAWYGTLLLARYNTGDVGVDGKDRGIKSAMVVWQKELSAFDGDIVREAAERCKVDHPKFPPTLPEFVAICKATQPRRAYSGPMKVEMAEGLKSSYTARARAEAMASYHATTRAAAGAVRTDAGLGGLHVLVARAVGLAGGDEVAVLRRFDRQAPACAAGQGTAMGAS
jgi:hypothetical protein